MRSHYLSFLLAGVLLQGSLAQTRETTPAKIKGALPAAPPTSPRRRRLYIWMTRATSPSCAKPATASRVFEDTPA
jgi:hypothetical protein